MRSQFLSDICRPHRRSSQTSMPLRLQDLHAAVDDPLSSFMLGELYISVAHAVSSRSYTVTFVGRQACSAVYSSSLGSPTIKKQSSSSRKIGRWWWCRRQLSHSGAYPAGVPGRSWWRVASQNSPPYPGRPMFHSGLGVVRSAAVTRQSSCQPGRTVPQLWAPRCLLSVPCGSG